MIRKAKFENFKGLRDVEITFDSRFTVLVGPNGTGKTSVLQGVEILLQTGLRPDGSNWLEAYLGRDKSKSLSIQFSDQAGDGIRLVHPTVERTQFLDTPAGNSGGYFGMYRASVITGHSETLAPRYEIGHTRNFGTVLRPAFQSSEIANPIITNATPPPVSQSGAGLPALLGYLKLRDDELFADIERHFCTLLPNIRKLRVDEQGGNGQAAPKALLFDTTYAQKVPAHHMSDGTLYILALIVAVLGPHRPKTLLIDDIDMRLHPKAQYELVTLLKKFLDEFPDLQIIATSHSPYILDKLEPNEVRVTGLGDDGSVVIAPLTDHPAYEKWKDSMSPGEFWSHTGEEWLKKLKRSAPTP